MSDIAKGILAGGWSLVAGWILPTATSLLLLSLLVTPNAQGFKAAESYLHASLALKAVTLVGASVIIGLTLNALQTPLYRILEGYLFWPPGLQRRSRIKRLKSKAQLEIRVAALNTKLRPPSDLEHSNNQVLLPKSPVVFKRFFSQEDAERTAVQRAILREQLRRYPIDSAQVAPTRLGNAIRRLEEYGYQRYRLDSQALWYQLAGAAPKQFRDQVDTARAGVDFFVCLLYGNALAAVIAIVTISFRRSNDPLLVAAASVFVAISWLSYYLAVIATDDWAAATRALVDVGRIALAESVGLEVPSILELEREMWQAYSRFVRRGYRSGNSSLLDQFRKGHGDRPSARIE